MAQTKTNLLFHILLSSFLILQILVCAYLHNLLTNYIKENPNTALLKPIHFPHLTNTKRNKNDNNPIPIPIVVERELNLEPMISYALTGSKELPESSTKEYKEVKDAMKSINANDIYKMYGTKPIMLGMESCETFRQNVPLHKRYIAPAGTFNTGTNFLSTLLHRNCHIPSELREDLKDDHKVMGIPYSREEGIRFQAPWGKHSPVDYIHHNVAQEGGKGIPQDDVLPIITIRDPYFWMGSMCRHPYQVLWKNRDDISDCPRVPNQISVEYSKSKKNYPSFLEFYNEWYNDWVSIISTRPRVIIRYEDLLFRPEQIIPDICHCAGGTLKSKDFTYRDSSAKSEIGSHKGGNGLIQSLVKYSSVGNRNSTLKHDGDVLYARDVLDEHLMELFHYDFV